MQIAIQAVIGFVLLFGSTFFSAEVQAAGCPGWSKEFVVRCESGYDCKRCSDQRFSCNLKCQDNGYASGQCQLSTSDIDGGVNVGICWANQNKNCICSESIVLKSDEADEEIFDIAPLTEKFWTFRDGNNQSPNSGVSNKCEARLHACFTNGYNDTNFSTNTSCKNECEDLTTRTNIACSVANCKARCDGWFDGSGVCPDVD